VSRLERVRAILPPDGADLVVFASEGLWSSADVVADDLKVSFAAALGE
jgi:hypothetical protein